MGCTALDNNETKKVETNGAGYINSENDKNKDVLDETQHNFSAEELYLNNTIKISSLVELNKDSMYILFGDEYNIINHAVLGSGYYYQKHDVMIILDEEDIAYIILVFENANINGVRLGMTVSEVQEILGDGELHYDDGEGDHYTEVRTIPYILFYVFEGFSLWFAGEEDGEIVDFEIRLWVW